MTSDSDFADIGACVFDAYGTLFDVHSAIGRGGGELGEQAAAVSDTWRMKQLEYTWLRSLMGAHVDFWQVTRDGLDFAFAAHGIDNPALRDRLMELYLSLDAYPEVADTLARLRAAGLKTAILSNGTPKMIASAVGSAGIESLLDAQLSVEEVGIYKPDARVYQLAVDRLDVAAGRICFLSSNCWDAHGAAHFGFKVAWINRFKKQDDNLPGAASAVISTLDELPGLLAITD